MAAPFFQSSSARPETPRSAFPRRHSGPSCGTSSARGERTRPTRPLCVCSKFAPYCARREPPLPVSRKTKPPGNAAYLGDGLLVPHDSLLDERVDLHVPVPARHHHPRPAEAHRHFHGSVSVPSPRLGGKASGGGYEEDSVWGGSGSMGLGVLHRRGDYGSSRFSAPEDIVLCAPRPPV